MNKNVEHININNIKKKLINENNHINHKHKNYKNICIIIMIS